MKNILVKVEWTTSELKEMVLVWLALMWGMLLLFPGNAFFPSSTIAPLGWYAEDWVWGALLVAVSLPVLVTNRSRFTLYRRFAHAFYWVFWMGIGCLALYRSSTNGIQETDLLLCLPFFAIAFMHGIIHIGLGRKL